MAGANEVGQMLSMRIALLLLTMVAATTQAAQVVVTDVTYTHSNATTNDSHSIVLPLVGTPSNWVSPVDYAHGTAVVRLEVFTKPSNAATRFQICFEGSPSYACTNQAPAYTTTGVYTWTTPFTSFYQYASVDWSQGVRDVALILKDTTNGKPADENVGATESARYMPTHLRVTVTLVSPGSTYVPPDAADAGSPDAGPVDAGTPDAGPADAGVPDAGAPDAGGVSEVDAGAEPEDAGMREVDAGEEADAGVPVMTDAGTNEEPAPVNMDVEGMGCGCQQGSSLGVLAGLMAVLLLRRRCSN